MLMKMQPEQLEGFPAEVQSVDPQRPVIEVAFDNLHHPGTYTGQMTELYAFIAQLLTARSNYSDDPARRCYELEVIETQMIDYVCQLWQEVPENTVDNARRAKMWLDTIHTQLEATRNSE